MARELHSALGLTEPPKRRKAAVRSEHFPGPNGGTFLVDFDDEGHEVFRRFIPATARRGMEMTGGES